MTHHRGGIRHGIHRSRRSGRDNLFYLYEEPEPLPLCFCNGVPCPDTGTLEKRSPLPAGHYWVDVFGKNIPTAGAWFKAMAGLGVHVDATEHFTATSVPEIRDWYLFTYTPTGGVPVVWDKSLGYPTIAAPGVKSSADTSQTPDSPLDPLNELSNWMNKVETELGGSIGGAAKLVPYALLGGLGVAGYLLLKEFGIIKKAKNVLRKRNSR